MNKQTLSVKIDVSKINKSRLYKGAKGTYLSAIILIKDEVDQYGNNGVIIEDVNKEEREAGVKGAILGNVKVLAGTSKNKGQYIAQQILDSQVKNGAVSIPDDSTDLPF